MDARRTVERAGRFQGLVVPHRHQFSSQPPAQPAPPSTAAAGSAGRPGRAKKHPDTPAWLIDNASLGPDKALEASEQSSRLQQIIRDLPEDKREVFRLVHQMEMSLREAADELGIPEGTAKSRLHYARERLSRQWQEWQAEQE